jgi:hypothetical protein
LFAFTFCPAFHFGLLTISFRTSLLTMAMAFSMGQTSPLRGGISLTRDAPT